nr:hypothetical protein 18 [bacterium]
MSKTYNITVNNLYEFPAEEVKIGDKFIVHADNPYHLRAMLNTVRRRVRYRLDALTTIVDNVMYIKPPNAYRGKYGALKETLEKKGVAIREYDRSMQATLYQWANAEGKQLRTQRFEDKMKITLC